MQIIMERCDDTEINTVIKATLWAIHKKFNVFSYFILQSHPSCFWPLALYFYWGCFQTQLENHHIKDHLLDG